MSPQRKFVIGDQSIAPGESCDLYLELTETYSGAEVPLPLRVMRAKRSGPAVLVTGAVHGDELNGTGVIRELCRNPPFDLIRGTLVLVPVVNIPGFERNARYMPDRRDLNRCFPGLQGGSLTSRLAHTVFEELVRPCDYCIDFHTAALHRTNFPNVRGDLSHPEVRRIADAFGASLLLDTVGPSKSLRRAATEAGCATIVVEAGEVWKIEPSIVESGVRGIENVLGELGMIDHAPLAPPYRAEIVNRRWLRADSGGMLSFHARPGDLVEKGQPVASCRTLLGEECAIVRAPRNGIVIGSTTLPSVKPGDPLCHFGVPRGGIRSIRRALKKLPRKGLHQRLRDDLGRSLYIEEPDDL